MEESWIYSKSFEAFEEKGRQLWRKHIKPYFKELKKDEVFCKEIQSLGGDSYVFDSKKLSPAFPIELILEVHTEYFGSSLECLKHALIYFAWRNNALALLDYGLDVAVREGIVDPSENSWCKQCGKCCTGAAGSLALTPEDEDRIVAFFKEKDFWDYGILEGYEEDGFEEAEQQIREVSLVCDFLGEPSMTSDGELYILACPFLERFNSKRSLCLIEPVKPQYCRNHDQNHCNIWNTA